ncbi:murein hydrolase activator EnvC family protein [Wielerella bovis]|uniref:murein hydrolase activator EnvC family protein n=1 Tax=Wielerella bovis TaxID=2917790 RepID=UPI003211F70E
MKSMKTVKPLLLSLALLGALPSMAANSAQGQLTDVRQAIQAAQKDLSAKQAAHRKTQQTLNQTKFALAQARRELDTLTRRQQDTWQKLQALQETLEGLQSDISSTKAQVARLVTSNYKNRQPNAVVLFLKDADANQKSRFLNYTRHINRANDQVIKNLGEQQKELAEQEKAINTELIRLRRLTDAQQQKLRRLGQANSQAQAESRKLNNEINNRQQRIARLREDEKRLNQVIAQIAAKEAAQRKAEAAARTDAARRRAEAAKRRGQTNKRGSGNLTAEDLALQPEKRVESSTIGRQQGRLPLPVSGQIVGSYGSARATGGTWRGLFVATAPASVRSLAAGRVSYAAPLAGYGNTVIIDHGSGYVSVYAGLSSIAVSNGSKVNAQQNIGTSGTLPAGEQGLYFELRYRGRTMNPRSWVNG